MRPSCAVLAWLGASACSSAPAPAEPLAAPIAASPRSASPLHEGDMPAAWRTCVRDDECVLVATRGPSQCCGFIRPEGAVHRDHEAETRARFGRTAEEKAADERAGSICKAECVVPRSSAACAQGVCSVRESR